MFFRDPDAALQNALYKSSGGAGYLKSINSKDEQCQDGLWAPKDTSGPRLIVNSPEIEGQNIVSFSKESSGEFKGVRFASGYSDNELQFPLSSVHGKLIRLGTFASLHPKTEITECVNNFHIVPYFTFHIKNIPNKKLAFSKISWWGFEFPKMLVECFRMCSDQFRTIYNGECLSVLLETTSAGTPTTCVQFRPVRCYPKGSKEPDGDSGAIQFNSSSGAVMPEVFSRIQEGYSFRIQFRLLRVLHEGLSKCPVMDLVQLRHVYDVVLSALSKRCGPSAEPWADILERVESMVSLNEWCEVARFSNTGKMIAYKQPRMFVVPGNEIETSQRIGSLLRGPVGETRMELAAGPNFTYRVHGTPGRFWSAEACKDSELFRIVKARAQNTVKHVGTRRTISNLLKFKNLKGFRDGTTFHLTRECQANLNGMLSKMVSDNTWTCRFAVSGTPYIERAASRMILTRTIKGIPHKGLCIVFGIRGSLSCLCPCNKAPPKYVPHKVEEMKSDLKKLYCSDSYQQSKKVEHLESLPTLSEQLAFMREQYPKKEIPFRYSKGFFRKQLETLCQAYNESMVHSVGPLLAKHKGKEQEFLLQIQRECTTRLRRSHYGEKTLHPSLKLIAFPFGLKIHGGHQCKGGGPPCYQLYCAVCGKLARNSTMNFRGGDINGYLLPKRLCEVLFDLNVSNPSKPGYRADLKPFYTRKRKRTSKITN